MISGYSKFKSDIKKLWEENTSGNKMPLQPLRVRMWFLFFSKKHFIIAQPPVEEHEAYLT